MYLLRCNRCGAVTTSEDASDPDPLVICRPGAGCCTEPHHHGEAANACPGGHGACPSPDDCPVLGQQHQPGPAGPGGPPPRVRCPGGHCGLGVPGCTVCRPITIIGISPAGAIRGQGS